MPMNPQSYLDRRRVRLEHEAAAAKFSREYAARQVECDKRSAAEARARGEARRAACIHPETQRTLITDVPSFAYYCEACGYVAKTGE